MKNIKKTISLLLMVALLLPIFPISDMIALAAGPNDIIMYINDVAITAGRCDYEDGSKSSVPVIVGTQDGIIRFRAASAQVEIYLNRESGHYDAIITSTSNNTNITFGTAEMPLEEIYTIVCGSHELLLLATSTSMNHVKFWYNGYTEGEETEPTYFIDSAGTAIFNTAKAYNGNREPYQFEFNVLVFSSKNNASYYYDPTGKTGNSNGINAVSFTFTDFLDGDLEPWWPTGSQTDGGSQTVGNGMLNIKSKNSNSVIFPAQYKISFPIKNISGSQTIDYFIALSGTPVIPVSADDDLLRRWNDVGSILTSITYKNPGEIARTVDLRNLYSNPSSALGLTKFNEFKNKNIVGRLINSSNDTDAQNAFREFYLFYARGMHSGALYTNSNDHARFTRLINEVLNSSTGAGYLSMIGAGLPDIKEGAVITATFDRVIGIRIYDNQKFDKYYLYGHAKKSFQQKTSSSFISRQIIEATSSNLKGIAKYGGYVAMLGINTLEMFPIFTSSANKLPYEIWGYRLTDTNQYYALTDRINTNYADRTPYEWSDATVQGWENQKSFNETFVYQASALATSWMRVKIVLREGSTNTPLDGSVIHKGISYKTSGTNKEAFVSAKVGDIINITEVNYTIAGKQLKSYTNLSVVYGGPSSQSNAKYEYNKNDNTLTIIVRPVEVSVYDADLTSTEIPSAITLVKKSGNSTTAPISVVSNNNVPVKLDTYFIADEIISLAAIYVGGDAYISTPTNGYDIDLFSGGSSRVYDVSGTRITFTYNSNSKSYIRVYLTHRIKYYSVYNGTKMEIYPPSAPTFLTSSTNYTLSNTQGNKSGAWFKNEACTIALSSLTVSKANLSSIITANQPVSLYFLVSTGNVSVEIRANGQPRTGNYIEGLGSTLKIRAVNKVEEVIDTAKVPVYAGKVIYGDMNYDGLVNIIDENIVLAYLNEERTLTSLQKIVGDYNRDGVVDKYDLAYIGECIKDDTKVKTYFVSKGDFNGDGFVNLTDYSLLFEILNLVNVSQYFTSSHGLFIAADVNNDNFLDAGDIGFIQEYIGFNKYEVLFYKNQKYGDFNENGMIDMFDYILMKMYMEGSEGLEITPDIAIISDVDHNGKVDGDDWATLREYYLGIKSTLGITYTYYYQASTTTWTLNYNSSRGIYSTTQPVPSGWYEILAADNTPLNKYIEVDSNHNGSEIINYYSYNVTGSMGVQVSGGGSVFNYVSNGVSYAFDGNVLLYAFVYPGHGIEFKNWKYNDVNGEVISTNESCAAKINKHTVFFGEASTMTAIKITLGKSDTHFITDKAWKDIEKDTNHKFSICLKNEYGEEVYPYNILDGVYRFWTTNNLTYDIYLNGKDTNLDVVSGNRNATVDFYRVKLEQLHVESDESPFVDVYFEGTKNVSTTQGYKKSLSAYLPSEISDSISGLPFLPGEQVVIKAEPRKDIEEGKLAYAMCYWNAKDMRLDLIQYPEVFLKPLVDINNDGDYDLEDYQALCDYINGIITIWDINEIDADVNNDGRINAIDAEVLLTAINNSYAVGTSQVVVVSKNDVRIIAYGDNVRVKVSWKNFYDENGVYQEEVIDWIKFGTYYVGRKYQDVHIENNRYLISDGWSDTTGAIIFPVETETGVSYQKKAIDDIEYTTDYVDRIYTIEYKGRTNDGTYDTLKVITGHFENDEFVVGNIPGLEEYTSNGTIYKFTEMWRCSSGIVSPDGQQNVADGTTLNIKYIMAGNNRIRDKYATITFEKLYDATEHNVYYYIYNDTTGVYEWYATQTYQYGQHIKALSYPKRNGYLFDGWYWNTPAGSKTPPERMGKNDIYAYGKWVSFYQNDYYLDVVIHNDGEEYQGLEHEGLIYKYAVDMSLNDSINWNSINNQSSNTRLYGSTGYEYSFLNYEMYPWIVNFNTGNSGISEFVMECPVQPDGWELYSGTGIFETRGNEAYFKFTNSNAEIRVKGITGSIILPHPGVYAGYTFEGWYTSPEFWPENRVGGAGDEYQPPYDNITLYARWIAQLQIIQTWKSVEGENEFRKGTDVILSFTAKNRAVYDYITSMNPTASIIVYGLAGEIIEIVEYSKLILVPSGESTVVWIPFHIDNNYQYDRIRAKCLVKVNGNVVSEGYGTWYVSVKNNVQTPDTAYSPQKAWWYIDNYNIGNVDISKSTGINNSENKKPDVVSSLTWVEWREPVPGKLAKFENTVSIDYKKTQTYIAPYGDNNAKYDNSDMTWKTKSGYGFTLSGKVSLKFSNAEIERDGAATGVQGANALFPEFNYLAFYHNGARNYITYNKSDISARNGFKNMMDLDGNIMLDTINGGYYGTYATLVKSENGNFILPLNTSTMNNIHYTPVWMPDGGYQVAVYYHDIWTPAGMLSYYDFSNALKLSGDMYDDIWFWSQSFNPANN